MSEGRRERLEQLYGENEQTDTTVIRRVEKDVQHLISTLEQLHEDHVVVLADTTRFAIARLRKWVD